MYFNEYAARLTAEHGSITLEADCTENGPILRHTEDPKSAPWKMDWAIFFSDGMHVYAYERWFSSGPKIAGRARRGYREHFSFHYGPTNPARNANGFPVRDKANFPAVIRIDRDKWGPHIHFRNEADHVPQSRVSGLLIEGLQPFEFVKAVLKHRASESKVDFDAIMKFTVGA